jgi:hypothetical protein
VFTICFAIAALFLLPDTPAKVITIRHPELAAHCIRRLQVDNKDDPQPITFKGVFSALTELHLWAMYLCLFCNGTTLFGLANFTPSIVATMGFGPTKTQLMTVPPFALAFVFTIVVALIADRYHCRGASVFTMNIFGIIGFALFVASSQVAIRYTGLCFAITGVYTMAPCYCAWVPNNTAGRTKRAAAIAMSFIFTNTGGIVSTWIYPKKDALLYLFAAKFNLALSAISIGLILLATLLLHRKNQLKMTRRGQLLEDVRDLPWLEQLQMLGDRHPDFKYTL